MVDFEPTLSVESALPVSVTTPGVEAAPVEHVQPAPVAEYVTPVSAAPAVTYAAPPPVVESVPVPIVEKTIEIPQLQIAEKIIDIPETQSVLGTRTSESLGTTPFRQAAPAELVEVVRMIETRGSLSCQAPKCT